MRDYNECRPYIEHLLAEHRRLHGLLRQTRASIVGSGGLDRDASSAQVAQVLRQLYDELENHFAQEESGGCLDEAVSRCPRLSGEARRIAAEHGDLLAKIQGVIAQTSGDNLVQNRLALEQAFDDLCRQIGAHERAENEVLKQGFGTNFNGDDIGQSTLIMDV